MAVKKKNPSGTGSRCENASIKQRSKQATLPKRQDASKGQRSTQVERSSRNGHTNASQGLKTYSNDPAQVQQWAAGATGYAPFEDHSIRHQYSASSSDEALISRTEGHFPGSFPMSRSSVSRFSAPQSSAQVFDTGLRTGFDEMCVTSSGNPVHGLPTCLNPQQPPRLNVDVNIPGALYQEEMWSYPTPVAEDMMYPNTAAMPATFMDSWPQMSCPPNQETAASGVPCTSNPMSWSPLSAVDASVSSSYSQSSYVGPQPDTPLSQAFQDGTWSSDQQGNMDPEPAAFQGFNIGESMQFPSPVEFIEQQDDGLRLVLCLKRPVC